MWLDKEAPEDNQDYIPGLYLTSLWRAPLGDQDLESRLLAFEIDLNPSIDARPSPPHRQDNLTFYERRALNKLKHDPSLLICDSDKNLGPVIITKPAYLKAIYTEHLSTTAYEQLTEVQATRINQPTRTKLNVLRKSITNKAEQTYLFRASRTQNRIHHLYGIPKLHKDPLKWRPIVSCVNGVTEAASKWLDHHMRRLLPYVISYLRDSQHVIDLVTDLGTLPSHARIFTADATGMCTNIDPDVGVQAIVNLIASLGNKLPPNFPSRLIVDTSRLVMIFNAFQIDATFWWQHIGTAMGTHCDCIYATTIYGYHEQTRILPRHAKNLALLGLIFDDMIGIWTGTEEEWPHFQDSLQGFGKLMWICSDLSSSVVFLDLTLSFTATNTITSCTYQKPLNLYLYIPPILRYTIM
jgi:hypothetical protein